MAILNCHSPPKLQILASSSLPDNNSSPSLSPLQPPPNDFDKLPMTKKDSNVKLQQVNHVKQKNQVQQPSVIEIERAIGAGIFRDRDTNRDDEDDNGLFGKMLRNSVGKNEGSVEKELRETGEWLIHQTERTSRSAGKQILMTLFIWILPMWIVAFLVASGAVQLPFDIPFLKDLIS